MAVAQNTIARYSEYWAVANSLLSYRRTLGLDGDSGTTQYNRVLPNNPPRVNYILRANTINELYDRITEAGRYTETYKLGCRSYNTSLCTGHYSHYARHYGYCSGHYTYYSGHYYYCRGHYANDSHYVYNNGYYSYRNGHHGNMVNARQTGNDTGRYGYNVAKCSYNNGRR